MVLAIKTYFQSIGMSAEFSSQTPEITQEGIVIELSMVDHRWIIYRRLEQMAIPCWCSLGQPLRVQVDSGLAVLQLWSIIRQVTASRGEHIDWLQRCWSMHTSTPLPDH
jgi:hypothetical protein